MVLGMIPDAPLDSVTSAGNAAGTGARMALLSRAERAHVQAMVGRIHKVETALRPRFQEHFVAAKQHPPQPPPAFPELKKVVSLPQVRFSAAGREGRRRRG